MFNNQKVTKEEWNELKAKCASKISEAKDKAQELAYSGDFSNDDILNVVLWADGTVKVCISDVNDLKESNCIDEEESYLRYIIIERYNAFSFDYYWLLDNSEEDFLNEIIDSGIMKGLLESLAKEEYLEFDEEYTIEDYDERYLLSDVGLENVCEILEKYFPEFWEQFRSDTINYIASLSYQADEERELYNYRDEDEYDDDEFMEHNYVIIGPEV